MGKFRSSFVTNSSSSSFIVLGVNADKYKDEFDKALPKNTWDEWESKVFDLRDGEYSEYISLANVEETLDDMSIKQAKQYFVSEAAKVGVKVNPKDVTFDYGATYDG
jgi:hypothetical protein